jgi:lysine decarboxylase
MTESTSPNSLLLGSLDAARRQAAVHGEELLTNTLEVLAGARAELDSMPGLEVIGNRLLERESVLAFDPLRLTIDVRGTGTTGYRVAEKLRETANINVELAADSVIVAVFGMASGLPTRARRLLDGIETTLGELEAERPDELPAFAPPPPWGEPRMTPRDAFLAAQDVVAFDQAEGRIAAEPLATYPPGVPNVLPGEVLTRETLDYIRESVEGGGFVRGATDRGLETLRVVRES